MKLNDKFTFSILQQEDLKECSELVARVFSMYDPFIFYLKISQEDLVTIIQSDLQSIIEDKLTIIAKDQENKICGCYAGFKLSRLASLYMRIRILILLRIK
jgi:hypothetical protein